MAVPTLNERSRSWVKAKFYDKDGNVQTPTAVQYRLDCETTGQVILDWTQFTTDTTVEIPVPGALNYIVNNGNTVERKVMTIQANSDDPNNAFSETQKWDLINLQGVT